MASTKTNVDALRGRMLEPVRKAREILDAAGYVAARPADPPPRIAASLPDVSESDEDEFDDDDEDDDEDDE